MFTHVSRDEGQEKLHFSHLYRYVSAYEYSKEMLDDLIEQIEEALIQAKKNTEILIVDHDGECCFNVYPNGKIQLMIPWKRYKIIRDEENND